jgi:hypothetical protein
MRDMPKMKIVELNNHAAGPTPRSLITCVTWYPGYKASDTMIPKKNVAVPTKVSIPASSLFVYFMKMITSEVTMGLLDIRGLRINQRLYNLHLFKTTAFQYPGLSSLLLNIEKGEYYL